MAKRASKSTKSADDALSAVEEALKIDFGQEADADSADELLADLSAASDLDMPDDDFEEDDRPTVSDREPASRRETIAPKAPAANDDRRSGTARFAAAIARKPSTSATWFAAGASVLWVLVAIWAGYSVLGSNLISPAAWGGSGSMPALFLFFASLVLPLLMIWGYAFMVRRAQELKLAAHSMTEVAYRLMEPETEAMNSVRSVGQAIRVEVGALTDGIERAMARASELEGLVHNEVSTLENSYSDNELRMRGLVEELANEREAIVNHTERVRSSISGASETLQEDLNISAQQISENVAEAQKQFSEALGNTNMDVRASLDQAGDTLLQQISQKGQEIGHQIEGVGGAIVGQIEGTQRTDKQCTG